MLNKYCAHPDRYGILREFARENRSNMTMAEQILWQNIRGKRLGMPFLRQFIIGDYIVDFVCRATGLIIEVDGAYHAEREQQEDDAMRQDYLTGLGYEVIRFTNEEVMFDIQNVINIIKCKIMK